MRVLLFVMLLSSAAQADQIWGGLSYGLSGMNAPATQSVSLMGRMMFVSPIADTFFVGVGGRYTSLNRNAELVVGDRKEKTLSKVELQALNVLIAADWVISEPWFVGMNLDVLGYTFSGSAVRLMPDNADAEPESINMFLYSKNDRGFLNSEFYVGYRAMPELMLRGGVSHQVIEYGGVGFTPDEKLQKFYNLFFVAIDCQFM